MRHTSRTITAIAAPVLAAALLVVPAPTAAAGPAEPVYGELVRNGTFDTVTAPWWGAEKASIAAVAGAMRITAAGTGTGTSGNLWDAVVGQNNINLRQGATYTLSFDAKASVPRTVKSTVQLGTAPYPVSLDRNVELTTTSKRFSWTFTSTLTTGDGHVDFQVGGLPEQNVITLDNISLTTSTAREGFYTDPANNAVKWADANSDPREAKIKAAIGDHNSSKWFGNWDADGNPNTGIQAEVSNYVGAAAAKGKLPVLVAYNIPGRDCGGASSGGSQDAALYKTWISAFAQGINGRPAVVILEPDAVAQSSDPACVAGEALEARFDMLWYANQHLAAQGPLVRTYLDAGNASWTLGPDFSGNSGIGLQRMAYLLNRSGVSMARGVSIGVANFHSTDISNQYGARLATQIKNDFGVDSRWVIDTARNGNGSYVTPGVPSSGHVGFCNPTGRKLGVTSRAGTGGAEYLLWIKNPGDSDGNSAQCPAGSPPAGAFSPNLAEALIDGR
ncbi:glycoside hydrolase family 6 protein [Streptomyces fulvorobeus]|uniref:Glucanase n=1 Tax=Streptomyces fulvorobeus TaxID=284028 RepID=A0A7J0CEC2_9ACTN|nr:glycoside hydrolase family 6 protein [Streptomyces fulvorobeus]NYE44337.1 endoglucanase [Streptomyces fulvorobeus]GFN00861.1 hypothetical protein Sfulv_56710 [Streptomyces fulvorobeus]